MNELKRSEFCPNCNSESIQAHSRYEINGTSAHRFRRGGKRPSGYPAKAAQGAA